MVISERYLDWHVYVLESRFLPPHDLIGDWGGAIKIWGDSALGTVGTKASMSMPTKRGQLRR